MADLEANKVKQQGEDIRWCLGFGSCLKPQISLHDICNGGSLAGYTHVLKVDANTPARLAAIVEQCSFVFHILSHLPLVIFMGTRSQFSTVIIRSHHPQDIDNLSSLAGHTHVLGVDANCNRPHAAILELCRFNFLVPVRPPLLGRMGATTGCAPAILPGHIKSQARRPCGQ